MSGGSTDRHIARVTDMKAISALVVWLLLLSGCSRDGASSAAVADTQARVALKRVLIDARTAAFDEAENLRDVASLREKLQSEGRLTALDSYGRTNVFFNPNLKLWTSSSESEDFAILVRQRDRYLGIRFDWGITSVTVSATSQLSTFK